MSHFGSCRGFGVPSAAPLDPVNRLERGVSRCPRLGFQVLCWEWRPCISEPPQGECKPTSNPGRSSGLCSTRVTLEDAMGCRRPIVSDEKALVSRVSSVLTGKTTLEIDAQDRDPASPRRSLKWTASTKRQYGLPTLRRRAVRGIRRPCPPRVKAGTVVDTTRSRMGRHVLRLKVRDASGNVAATSPHGFQWRAIRIRQASRSCIYARGCRSEAIHPKGASLRSRTVIEGTLTDAGETAVAGVAVGEGETVDASSAHRAVGSVTTDASGNFRYSSGPVPAGRSIWSMAGQAQA